MNNPEENSSKDPEFKKNIRRRIFQVFLTLLIIVAVLFVSSGKLNWIYAWIYILASLLILAVNFYVFPVELIAERGRKKENVETFDSVITKIIAVFMFAVYLVSGLDIRFSWTGEMPISVHIAGIIAYIAGNGFVSWAMAVNTFFSTAVRLQFDRGHHVVSSGPYAIVRHPGYLGIIVYLLATPLLLGSLTALIPAFITFFLFVIRTYLEDKTLKEKLDGYSEYSKKIKYRLLPGIW